MSIVSNESFSIECQDVTGQKTVRVSGVEPASSIGHLSDSLVKQMKLSQRDAEGRPLTYQVRLEREGRQLHASEQIGDVLQANDRIVLQPNVMAGGMCRSFNG